MKNFIWYSDLHLNLSVLPYFKRLYVSHLSKSYADGLFITGDISTGPLLASDLRFLAKHFKGQIYFVLGNHDYHCRYIDSVHADVRKVCKQFPNLHWLTDEPVISLSNDTAVIGVDGWYDAAFGNLSLLTCTSDWVLTFDFLKLPTMESRHEAWRQIAEESAHMIKKRLEEALLKHKTVYVLTHFPPWREASGSYQSLIDDLWLSYNTNAIMGNAIVEVSRMHTNKRIVVLCGHTHTPKRVRINGVIECKVASASYWGRVHVEETITI